ncbi:MAG: tRNA uridine-5-carboxymethylaminomethyl(34) synthesis GTPase MnmE [Desulfuromonadales bacterium]
MPAKMPANNENPIDTIVAPLTPPGVGGVGILRLSGPNAESLLSRFFSPSRPTTRLSSYRLYHGRMIGTQGEIIDEVLAVVMRQPHSYTREDVAEVHCHGGRQVMRRILDLFIDAGGRLARPGEFTERAFLNGRIDLAQAEAVMDVIHAASDRAREVAVGQLEGKLSAVVYQIRAKVVELLAFVESHIDFPDEDIDFPSRSFLEQNAQKLMVQIDHLLSTFDSGRTLREGLSLLIIGKPNVGKSSLMNALLGEARAIVTSTAGTTRDTIEENLLLAGIPLRLIDSAGIRETSDPVESEGVLRAKKIAAFADLILLVVDGSAPLDDDDLLAADVCRGRKTLLVVNKADRPALCSVDELSSLPQVSVSAQTGQGFDALQEMVVELCLPSVSNDFSESILISDRRHRESLVRSLDYLKQFMEAFHQEASPEILALELRGVLAALGEITGETAPDEILETIFSRFCIGK